MSAKLTQYPVQVLATGVPKARLTQNILQVLATGEPKARLTQASVLVLAANTSNNINNVSITDTLSLTEVTSNYTLNLTILDTFNLTDESILNLLRIGDILVFDDSVTNTTIFKTLTDTLSLTELLNGYTLTISAHDTITFSTVTTGTKIYVADTLALTESLYLQSHLVKYVSDIVTYTDAAIRTLIATLTDSFNLTESNSTDKINPTYDVLEPFDTVSVITEIADTLADPFNLNESIIANASIPILDNLSLNDSIIGINSKGLADTISITDILTINKSITKSTFDSVTYNETKSLNRQSQLSTNDNLGVNDSIEVIRVQFVSIIDTTIIIDELIGLRHDEAVFETINFDSTTSSIKIAVGNSPDDLNLIDSNSLNTLINFNLNDEFIPRELAFAITADKYLMLIGVNKAIALPPPEFNDNYATQQKTIFKRMMDASVRTYNKTSDNEKIHYDFIITRTQADNLREFLDSENGNFINLIDWRGYRYQVKLLTDSINFEESGRWEPCGNKVRTSMEFLGKRCMT